MAKVAFLGLGVMGYPMAGHLLKKGAHDVTVYNRSAAKAQQWVKEYGGRSAATPKEAAQGCDFVMMCVGNDNDVRDVALGANGAFDGMGKGTVFVDHTTASAEIARTLHAEARKRGFDFVDAPVSGGQAGAENGVLTVMCGGDAGPYERAEKVIASSGVGLVRSSFTNSSEGRSEGRAAMSSSATGKAWNRSLAVLNRILGAICRPRLPVSRHVPPNS